LVAAFWDQLDIAWLRSGLWSEIYGIFYCLILLLLLLTALRLCTSGSAQIPFSFGHDVRYLMVFRSAFVGIFWVCLSCKIRLNIWLCFVKPKLLLVRADNK
jgi:hypothetical protein